MTSRVWTADIDDYLAQAGHTDYDVRRDSPYTVRVIHDGPQPRTHLEEYATCLHALGYRTTIEEATDIRPLRLKITQA
ncbi:hypothetical protein OG785_45380 [Streptomyces sp. NBC_00006]|uniref:hypothetical protein n=1 Tax=Streptomyces sp. NBC_00006 TaxID=2975619 RepID=UPI00225A886F|nr:hypothetical protein [Streptomyces sp. NBC_00006]MCX5528976.1 hypothetical protein [Streptomyces sp. NBC_00006]MCX5537792.1 hypothetical protein [Streptomyces sp. NBC_00006]